MELEVVQNEKRPVGGLFFKWQNYWILIKNIFSSNGSIKAVSCLLYSKSKKKVLSQKGVFFSPKSFSFILIKEPWLSRKFFIIEEPLKKGYAVSIVDKRIFLEKALITEGVIKYFNFKKERGVATTGGGDVSLRLRNLGSPERDVFPGEKVSLLISASSLPYVEIWKIDKK